MQVYVMHISLILYPEVSWMCFIIQLRSVMKHVSTVHGYIMHVSTMHVSMILAPDICVYYACMHDAGMIYMMLSP